MFSNNRFLLVKIVFTLSVAIVLFGVGKQVLAQTPSCTSPVSGSPVSDAQFVNDAKTACTDAGRTDTDACVAEMRSNFCASSQTPPTSNNNSNIGADVLGVTIPVIGVTIKGILWIVDMLVGVLISLVGMLAGWALQFNLSILDFSPSFVMTGWTIFRDIANLGFVLGIIIIAIATILRYKNYTAKQILWKLIVAALVVNFSLVIAGAFITASNSVSSYLLNAIGGDVPGKIGDSFGYTDIVNGLASWGIGDALLGFVGSSSSFAVIMSLAVVLIFGVIFLFTLLAFAGMLLLRYFWLVFLIMISPVTWLLWIFPSTSKYFKQWWEKFLHWIQYAPLMLIFMYIALSVLAGWTKYQALIEKQIGPGYAFMGLGGSSSGSNKLHFGTLMVAVIACALLIGGMKMAQAMGMGGAAWALSAADKTKKWAQKRAKRTGSAVGTRALNYKKDKENGKSAKERVQAWGSSKWGKRIGLNVLARQTTLADSKMKKVAYEDVEDLKKKYASLSPEEQQQILGTFRSGKVMGKFGGTDGQAAMYEMLAEKDSLGEKTPKDIDVLAQVFDLLNKQGKGKTASEIKKKLALNDRAIQYGLDAKKGIAGAEDQMIKEMIDEISKMTEDEYKTYMKNMGNTIGQKTKDVFGVVGNSITTKLFEYNVKEGVEDSTMVRAMSSSIKNKIDPKTGALKAGTLNYVGEYAKSAIKAQLDWMNDYIKDYRIEIDAYKGRGSGNFDPKKVEKMEAEYNKMLSEQTQFGDIYNRNLTTLDFSTLVDRMKKTSTSSISEMRDFARALKIA